MYTYKCMSIYKYMQFIFLDLLPTLTIFFSSIQKGLGVSHEMELNTISALRKLAIDVIISPYEADAQLAHLCNIGNTNTDIYLYVYTFTNVYINMYIYL